MFWCAWMQVWALTLFFAKMLRPGKGLLLFWSRCLTASSFWRNRRRHTLVSFSFVLRDLGSCRFRALRHQDQPIRLCTKEAKENCFAELWLSYKRFPECVAKGSRLTWESEGRAVFAGRCFRDRNRSQPSSSVRIRLLWPCRWGEL